MFASILGLFLFYNSVVVCFLFVIIMLYVLVLYILQPSPCLPWWAPVRARVPARGATLFLYMVFVFLYMVFVLLLLFGTLCCTLCWATKSISWAPDEDDENDDEEEEERRTEAAAADSGILPQHDK